MAQRLWHWEGKTGPSSLLTIMLRSSSLWTRTLHPWLLFHCAGFALAFFSCSCIQSWEPGLWQHTADCHIFSLHTSHVGPDGREKGLHPRVQHPGSPAVQTSGTVTAERLTEVNLQNKDYRSEDWLLSSCMYRMQGKRGVSVILKTLSPITCNSDMNLGHIWMEAG